MSRTRASAKAAGARFERLLADWLAARLDNDAIDRRVKTGAKDRGDIGAVRTCLGARVVIEAKDYAGQVKVAEWLREAEIEAGNDDAPIGVVMFKRRGIGDPAEQGVLMSAETFARLLEGGILPDDTTT